MKKCGIGDPFSRSEASSPSTSPDPQEQPRRQPPINSGRRPPHAPHAPRPEDDNPDDQQAHYYLALAHWLADIHQPTSSAQTQLWRLMSTARFADFWYGARATAETLRGEALRWLSLHQRQPGGAAPDPRTPASETPFSLQAIVSCVATQVLHISIEPVTEAVARATADPLLPSPDSPRPLCWLHTYPDGAAPTLAVRHATNLHTKLLFDMAQLIGYLCKERPRIADPTAPGGVILLPTDTAIETVLHQFAIALLGLPRDCPTEWPCVCNALRARYNAAPLTHPEATQALSLEELRSIRSRQVGKQQLANGQEGKEQDP